MRQAFFTYLPKFALDFVGNHKPEIRDNDNAIKRRFHLVPFIINPREIDTTLPEKLRAEYPAILHWFLEGCIAWQQQGLNPPESVRAATHEYFSDEDPVQRWVDEACITGRQYPTPMLTLFHSWSRWAVERGERVGIVMRLSPNLLMMPYGRGLV